MLLTLIAARSCQRNVYSCDELILLLFVQCLPPLLSSLLYFCTCPVPGTREIFVEQMNEEMSEGRKSSCIFLDHQNPIFPLLVCDPKETWATYGMPTLCSFLAIHQGIFLLPADSRACFV